MASTKDPEPVKPPLPQPPREDVESLDVAHPLYDRVILTFGCRTQTADGVMVMSKPLVEQGAAIVAGTKGYLSSSIDRAAARLPDADVVIPAGLYYFHADDPAARDYAICADFDAWEPPAGPADLPEPWRALTEAFLTRTVPQPGNKASEIEGWVKRKDIYCMLSGEADVTQCHHLLLERHAEWARQWLGLSHYEPLAGLYPADRIVDDARYLVTMNPSTHILLDAGLFCPFPVRAADGSNIFVAYFVSPLQLYSTSKYHLRTLSLPPRTSPFALYLQFAWTVISCIPPWNIVPTKPLPEWALNNVRSESSESDGSSSDGIIKPPAVLCKCEIDYPGMGRIDRLRAEYLKDHPEVFATGDPNTLRLG